MKQWDDVRYFLAVARQRSLSGAARELAVNHATVYRRIQARRPLIVWGDVRPDDLDVLARRLDPQALAVLPVVQDEGTAETIWRRLKRR